MAINQALKAVEALKFSGDKDQADFDFAVRKYRTYGAADGMDFQVAIYGAGFEASRNLNRDDLLTIREWIDTALAGASERKVA